MIKIMCKKKLELKVDIIKKSSILREKVKKVLI